MSVGLLILDDLCQMFAMGEMGKQQLHGSSSSESYSHALLRIHVIGGQRSVRIAPPSLPPHYSCQATRDFQSSISVEALFHKYLLSSVMVQHCGLLPVDQVVVSHACSATADFSVTPLSQASQCTFSLVWSPQCRPGRSCRGYDIPH